MSEFDKGQQFFVRELFNLLCDIYALNLIIQNPIKQLLIFHLTCRDGKTDTRDLGIGAAQAARVRRR